MNDQLEQARLMRCRHDWPVYHLKHLARLTGGGTPAKENGAFWEGGDVPWISPKDMKRRVITSAEDYITEDAVDGSATSFVDAGSPLMVVRSGILRHTLPVAIAGRRLTLNQDMKAFNLSSRLNPMFFVYWVEGQSSDLLLEWRQFGATVESIDTGRLLNGRLALPDLPTQKAIADFLDRETARIDQLIEKKQRMVEVLGEKRQAVISRAVTTGLDPSVRMKESCVEWIGALPESSGVRRGKFLFREGNARSKTGGEELLSVSHVTGVTRRSEKNVYMFLAESNEDYKLVTTGDVVVNTMWAWMGAIGVSPIDGLISPSYGVYGPTGNHYLPQYLELLLRSRPFVAEVNRRSKGVWSSRLRLYPDAFLDISFPVPSREDQARTLSALAYATKRESTLGELGARSIDRLREFRSALITAAVTGQIDVSTWGKQGRTDHHLDPIEEATSA